MSQKSPGKSKQILAREVRLLININKITVFSVYCLELLNVCIFFVFYTLGKSYLNLCLPVRLSICLFVGKAQGRGFVHFSRKTSNLTFMKLRFFVLFTRETVLAIFKVCPY